MITNPYRARPTQRRIRVGEPSWIAWLRYQWQRIRHPDYYRPYHRVYVHYV